MSAAWFDNFMVQQWLPAAGLISRLHAGIRVAIAWGYLSAPDAVQALEALDQLGGRVFGLSRH